MSDGSGKLAYAAKNLRRKWDEVSETWRDAVKADFESRHLNPLLTQTTAFCSLDVFSLERSADLLLVLIIGGTGYLYGGLIGAVIYKFLQDWIANLTPQYWQFWIGLVLVVIVLIGRERMASWVRVVRGVLARLAARVAPRLPALGGAKSEGH